MIHGDHDDVLWLAGLLEGEGTFDSHAHKYPRIRLEMVDRDIVGRAASLMDVPCHLALHPAPAQPTWTAELQGDRAAAIMREVLPFMGSRRSGRIAAVLAVHEFRNPANAGRKRIPGPYVTRPAGIAKPATAA